MSAEGDAAIFARLRGDEQLADAVFEGTVKNPPKRYVSIFAPIGSDSSDRLAGPSNVNETTYTIHSVATTVEQCKWVARRVQALLTDHTVEAAYPSDDLYPSDDFFPTDFQWAGRITHPVSLPPRLDRDANPPLWYVVDQYDLTQS